MENYLKQQKQLQGIEDSSKIRSEINDIDNFIMIHKNELDFINKITLEFSDFNERYPVLFKKLIHQECDRDQLEFLLLRLEEVRTGSKSQHDASVEVGQILVDNYVKPKLAEKERNEEELS